MIGNRARVRRPILTGWSGLRRRSAADAGWQTVPAADVWAQADQRIAGHAQRLVSIVALLLTVFLLWAWQAEVVEVSSGQGTVVPRAGLQVIQSLDGGVLQALHVTSGDRVRAGQPLAELDPTRTQAEFDEVMARYQGALARKARLQAEVEQREPDFPDALLGADAVIAAELALFRERQRHQRRARRDLEASLTLVSGEREITEQLVSRGAASEVEVLRLRRTEAELHHQLNELHDRFLVQARDDLASVRTEVEAHASRLRGLEDARRQLTLRSPVRGRVQNLEISTVGGVVAPNGKLMEIVPEGDRLLVEAQISPRDIAFIHPGQAARVKLTAYDYATYGALDGRVLNIAPDTTRDEVNPEWVYYRVTIETDSDALETDNGRRHPIAPGMIAEVDIRTGQKTVLDYLIKPFNRTREALRER